MAALKDVAGALAAAFLAEGGWSRAALVARGTEVLDERPAWLGTVASRVIARYQDPPAGRLRELTRFVAGLPALRGACARGDATRVRRWLRPRIEMRATRWDVPPLATPGTVASWLGLSPTELEWFADARGLERLVTREPLRHYTYRWVSKRPDGSGGARLLEAPKGGLKAIQRKVLHGILDRIAPHDAVHGFRRGRSVCTHAAPHAGQAVVMRLDLADFFLSIAAKRVSGVFRMAGYPEEVAFVLACLCTNRAPVDAIANRRALGPRAAAADVAAWARAEQLARSRHLPQGAPTSPALANLVAFGLDVRLSAAAASVGATYTRYADDLVFSGPHAFSRRASGFAALVGAVAIEEGFAFNHRKTRVMRAGGRQRVAGLVVNERPRVSRAEADRVKAIVHNSERLGPASQNREGREDFRSYVRGLIAWIGASDAERGRRLLEGFERIRWE